VASSCSALICLSWVCHFDWQEQIADVAADAVEPDVMEPDALPMSSVGCSLSWQLLLDL
jgi:hypothetical protein